MLGIPCCRQGGCHNELNAFLVSLGKSSLKININQAANVNNTT